MDCARCVITRDPSEEAAVRRLFRVIPRSALNNSSETRQVGGLADPVRSVNGLMTLDFHAVWILTGVGAVVFATCAVRRDHVRPSASAEIRARRREQGWHSGAAAVGLTLAAAADGRSGVRRAARLAHAARA